MGLHARESTEMEELYLLWSLFIVCVLLILPLLTSYYLQVNRIRAVHETVVSIFASMVVGLIVRLAPGHLIRERLVRGFRRSTAYDVAHRRLSQTFSHTLSFNLLLTPIILHSATEPRKQANSSFQHLQRVEEASLFLQKYNWSPDAAIDVY